MVIPQQAVNLPEGNYHWIIANQLQKKNNITAKISPLIHGYWDFGHASHGPAPRHLSPVALVPRIALHRDWLRRGIELRSAFSASREEAEERQLGAEERWMGVELLGG
jgi:hypothetical protein